MFPLSFFFFLPLLLVRRECTAFYFFVDRIEIIRVEPTIAAPSDRRVTGSLFFFRGLR